MQPTLAPSVNTARVTRRSPAYVLTAGLAAVLIAAIWLVALERVRYEGEQAVESESIKNDKLALAHEERIARSIEVFDGALRTVRHLFLNGGLPRDLGPLLQASGLDKNYYTVFSVIGADGQAVASNVPSMTTNFADRGYFRTHANDKEDRLLIGPPIVGRQTGRWVVSLTRRIEAPDGRFLGVMFVAIDPRFLVSPSDQTSLGPNGVVALIGLDGISRVRLAGNTVTYGEEVSKSPVFQAAQRARVGHFVASGVVDGVVRAMSYRQMTGYPLIAVVNSALSDLQGPLQERERAIYSTAAIGSLLTLGLWLCAALLIRNGLRTARVAEASALDQARLNEALQQSESRSNRIIESAPSAMIVVDATGTITRANTRAENLFGFGAGEMQGLAVDQLVPTEARGRHAGHRRGFLLDGSTRVMGQGIELFACRKDGSPFPVEIGLAPLDLGESLQTIASIVDITQRKAIAAELLEHRDRLEQQVAARTVDLVNARDEAHRLAQVKTQFLANMSHEIRTPLNAISGMAHLIRRQGLSEKQSRQMDTLHRSAEHLLSVINAILELSKIDAGAMHLAHEPVDVASLVKDVVDMQHSAANLKGVNLGFELGPLPDALMGDRTRLRQGLLNYVANAVKFTAAGHIVVRAFAVEQGPGFALIRFEVQDTGIGISSEALPRLFNAFEQADSSRTRQFGGTGLGLAITRMVAKQMGGETGAESQLDRGSLFWFTARLVRDPLARDATGAPAPVGVQPQVLKRHAGALVMVVDDEPVNREVAISLLEELGLEVLVACRGDEAVDLLQQHRPALVLMDVQMPVMDGLTATRHIRKRPEHLGLPIIALTASAFAEDEAACRDAGMNAFISKPLVADHLYRVVLSHLDNPGPARPRQDAGRPS